MKKPLISLRSGITENFLFMPAYKIDAIQGVPPPNNTLLPAELLQPIELRGVQPGTNYRFRLLFWNATLNAWPAWTLTLATGFFYFLQ